MLIQLKTTKRKRENFPLVHILHAFPFLKQNRENSKQFSLHSQPVTELNLDPVA